MSISDRAFSAGPLSGKLFGRLWNLAGVVLNVKTILDIRNLWLRGRHSCGVAHNVMHGLPVPVQSAISRSGPASFLQILELRDWIRIQAARLLSKPPSSTLYLSAWST